MLPESFQIAAEPYQTISFKIQAREIDSTSAPPPPPIFFFLGFASAHKVLRHIPKRNVYRHRGYELGALGSGHQDALDAVPLCAAQLKAPDPLLPTDPVL